MRIKVLIIVLFFTCATVDVYAVSGRQHDFEEHECPLCHHDVKKDPRNIKDTVALACNACHLRIKQTLSHPTDIYPVKSIPAAMPLIDGKLTCITCHYTHPGENVNYSEDNRFLRRLIRGINFCMSCHEMDKNKHITVEHIHPGTFTAKEDRTRIDRMSLACIECHYSQVDSFEGFLGGPRLNNFRKDFTHPVGIEYDRISTRNRRSFNPSGMLSKDIKLYDGKIGCGTCHSIYSKERKMLVTDNQGSKLCFQCHAK